MTQHRHAVKHQLDTPVAEHFKLASHEITVSVLETTPEDTLKRRIVERRWIQRLRGSKLHTTLNRDEGIDAMLL